MKEKRGEFDLITLCFLRITPWLILHKNLKYHILLPNLSIAFLGICKYNGLKK
jgi:hypothetical protein